MRRLGAWALVALLVSGCGLTVGVRSADAHPRPAPDDQLVSLAFGDAGAGAVDTTTSSMPGSAGEAPDVNGEAPPMRSPAAVTSSTAPGSNTPGDTDPGGDEAEEPTTPPSVAETTTTTDADPDPTTTTTTAVTPDLDPFGTVFGDDDAFVAHACDGDGVTIAGDTGDYTLEGSCGRVLILGSFNTVFIEDAERIDLTGTLNAVVFASGDPAVNDYDGDNIVTGG